MEGSVLVSYNIDNNKTNPIESIETDSDLSSSTPLRTGNFNDAFTKVYHGSGNANDVLLGFIDRAKTKMDAVIIYTAPSVIIETDAIREKMMAVFK